MSAGRPTRTSPRSRATSPPRRRRGGRRRAARGQAGVHSRARPLPARRTRTWRATNVAELAGGRTGRGRPLRDGPRARGARGPTHARAPPPCFFDRATAVGRRRRVRPAGRRAARVPVCEADAVRLERGEEPDPRSEVISGRSVPYWSAPGAGLLRRRVRRLRARPARRLPARVGVRRGTGLGRRWDGGGTVIPAAAGTSAAATSVAGLRRRRLRWRRGLRWRRLLGRRTSPTWVPPTPIIGGRWPARRTSSSSARTAVPRSVRTSRSARTAARACASARRRSSATARSPSRSPRSRRRAAPRDRRAGRAPTCAPWSIRARGRR